MRGSTVPVEAAPLSERHAALSIDAIGATPPARRPTWVVLVVASAAYLFIAALVTFPFVLRPTTTLLAPEGGDVLGSAAKFAVLARDGVNPVTHGRLTSVAFPDGVRTSPGVDRASALSAVPVWIGSTFIGSVATHGLNGLFGYTWTASAMFALVYWLTRSAGAAFLAGLAFGFWPHLYLMSWAATTYTHMWLFLLPLCAFTWLVSRPAPGRAAAAGASVIPAMYWTPYYALHVQVVAVACIAATACLWARSRTRPAQLKHLAVATAVPWLTGLSVYALIGATSSPGDIPQRTLEEAYQQSAHPAMYLVPGYASSWGDAPSRLLARLIGRDPGANLYLGLSVLALAVLGVVHTVRGLRRARRADRQPERATTAGLLASAAVVACFLCSLAPTVELLGLELPTPNWLIVTLQPAFRAGQRFVMPIQAGVCVLAGLGAWPILRRLDWRRAAVVTAVLAAVVFADLWTRPPHATTELRASRALAALEAAPSAPVLHITYSGINGFAPMLPCLLQPQHGNVLVNGCGITPDTPYLTELVASEPCDMLGKVRRHVRYVIVDDRQAAHLTCFEQGRAGPYRVLAGDDEWVVLEYVDVA